MAQISVEIIRLTGSLLRGNLQSKISKSLRQAGIHKVKALRNFFLVRSVLAFALPGCFVLAVCAATGPFTGLGSAEPN